MNMDMTMNRCKYVFMGFLPTFQFTSAHDPCLIQGKYFHCVTMRKRFKLLEG